jgi:hypothetical protein
MKICTGGVIPSKMSWVLLLACVASSAPRHHRSASRVERRVWRLARCVWRTLRAPSPHARGLDTRGDRGLSLAPHVPFSSRPYTRPRRPGHSGPHTYSYHMRNTNTRSRTLEDPHVRPGTPLHRCFFSRTAIGAHHHAGPCSMRVILPKFLLRSDTDPAGSNSARQHGAPSRDMVSARTRTPAQSTRRTVVTPPS